MTDIKSCQSCKSDFSIAPEDFAFYAKMQVPPPTWCPDCRAKRRLVWRNERSLYQRECAATGQPILTMFSPHSDVVVYDRDYWWSDEWDQLASGRDYDFSRPFFEQYRELLARAPLPNLTNTNVEGSDFGNYNTNVSDCYLLFGSYQCQNVSFSSGCVDVRDSQDLCITEYCEQCYNSTLCGTVYNSSFCFDVDDTHDSAFIRLSKNLKDCLGCINLKYKQYHIFNKPYSKEEYEQKLAEYDFGSYKALTSFQQQYATFIAPYPRRYATILNCEDCTGDQILRSKNLARCFDIYGEVQDAKYITHAIGVKDVYDGYGMGVESQLLYEGASVSMHAYRCSFVVDTHSCREVTYAYECHNSQNLFGCVGLRQKQYCIFNKQCTKEEYEALVPEIVQHMNAMPYVDALGREYRFGEFFPPDLSPFAYNETCGRERFPLSEQQALAEGYRWLASQRSEHATTIKAADLPDHIKDVDNSILQQVIACEHEQSCNDQCTQAFKIQPQELAFLLKKQMPLPRLCPNCRHAKRFSDRLPTQLHDGTCQCLGTTSRDGLYTNQTMHVHGSEPCGVTYQTPYAPGRPEVVYCNSCYQQEVL